MTNNTPTPAQALGEVREVDGMKVAFVPHESYFAGLHTESMYRTSKRTGADIVLLLGEGKAHADLSDDDIRELIAAFLAARG